MQISNQTTVTNEDLDVVVPVITDDVSLLGVPGVLVEMSPNDADSWGADYSDPIEVEEAWKDSLLQTKEEILGSRGYEKRLCRRINGAFN